jgi:hypothetical protein
MSTSDRTINQVRAILNKLDRSIDEAREKRTHTGPAPVPQAPPSPPVPAKVQQLPPAAAPTTPGSQYGRAQPMPKAQPSSNVLRWKT